MSAPWEGIGLRKRAALEASIPQEWRLDVTQPRALKDVLAIPQECGKLTAAELRITQDYDATALLEELTRSKLKSVEVVTAFAKRAAIAHQLVRIYCRIKRLSNQFARPIASQNSFQKKRLNAPPI